MMKINGMKIHGATNTQKTVMLAIYEGWLLRLVDGRGWCLFQPGRTRPFADVKEKHVEAMTEAGWLTPGSTPKGLGFRPAKDLTAAGRKYAERLVRENWATSYDWDEERHIDGRVGDPGERGSFRLAA